MYLVNYDDMIVYLIVFNFIKQNVCIINTHNHRRFHWIYLDSTPSSNISMKILKKISKEINLEKSLCLHELSNNGET